MAIAIAFLLASVIGTLFGKLPAVIPVGYSILSCLSYIAYALDKVAAGKNSRRVPENTLHFMDLIGGWPGALIAQQQFRHKTVKASFQAVFWLTVLVNIAVVIWTLRSNFAALLAIF